MMKFIVGMAMAALVAATESSCVREGADNQVAQQTQQAASDIQARVGLPRITNYTETRLVNWLYELRDRPNMSTYTYTRDMNGRLHCIGRSIGFGIPYSMQRTNPERVESYSYGITLPQPEPNGLFPPDSAAATWVIMPNANGQPEANYIEDNVEVFTSPPQYDVATPCR